MDFLFLERYNWYKIDVTINNPPSKKLNFLRLYISIQNYLEKDLNFFWMRMYNFSILSERKI